MPFTITAAVNPYVPGAVNLAVIGDAGVPSSITRLDGAYPQQPVRNFDTTASGAETVVDCEAPLGRPVRYNLLDAAGAILAQSEPVTVPDDPANRSLLRSVLRPSVSWLWVEPQDETGVQWKSSTTVHEIPGSDTPTVVAEVRQRHTGVIVFLCKSVAEADQLIALCRDGTLMLLRHSPCAGVQARDMLFYPMEATEVRQGRLGWRSVAVEYQSSKFVPGWTDEPPFSVGWDFQALSDSAPDFATLTSKWANFGSMALLPEPPYTPLGDR